jgi:hypothetical protein
MSFMVSFIFILVRVQRALDARGLYCHLVRVQRKRHQERWRTRFHSHEPGSDGLAREGEDPRDLWGRNAGAPRSLLSLLGPAGTSAGAMAPLARYDRREFEVNLTPQKE